MRRKVQLEENFLKRGDQNSLLKKSRGKKTQPGTTGVKKHYEGVIPG